MHKKMKARQSSIFDRYPTVKFDMEEQAASRREEIINELLEADEHYQELTKKIATTSQSVLSVMLTNDDVENFEAFSNAVTEAGVYELDILYKEAFIDALEVIEMLGL